MRRVANAHRRVVVLRRRLSVQFVPVSEDVAGAGAVADVHGASRRAGVANFGKESRWRGSVALTSGPRHLERTEPAQKNTKREGAYEHLPPVLEHWNARTSLRGARACARVSLCAHKRLLRSRILPRDLAMGPVGWRPQE